MSEKETTILRQQPSSKTLSTKRPKVNIPEGKLFVQRDDEDKKFEELVNSDKEINKLKKTIFDEAVNTRVDYEQNPNEDSSSLQPLIVIHQNSEFLEEE
jgi:hypothetical protein